jgi:glycosyltransferase involved in cell wall biosynthesis
MEWMHFFVMVYYLLFRYRLKNYTHINFHIAYPNLIYYHLIRRLVPCKVIITEHWSYYHYHFHSTRKLRRIKRIFSRGYPLICVSGALEQDIRTFSGADVRAHIVPNAIRDEIFNHQNRNRKKTLLMGSYWKAPKEPRLAIDAFLSIRDRYLDFNLLIYGYGPMEPELKTLGAQNGLTWLGQLKPEQIAQQLNDVLGFLMPSRYETFSVGTAEALCCGTPVVVSNAGALPDLVTDNNGILVNSDQDWETAIETLINSHWDYDKISREALDKYSSKSVGQTYFNVIKSL